MTPELPRKLGLLDCTSTPEHLRLGRQAPMIVVQPEALPTYEITLSGP